VKFIAFILLVFFCNRIANSQSSFPAGVANIHLLNEKDGYPGYSYYYALKDSAGLNYSIDFNNNFCISGNNFYSCTDTLRRKYGNVHYIKLLGPGKTILIGGRSIYWFQNTTLEKEISLPHELFACFLVSNSSKYLIFTIVRDSLMYYVLENDKLSSLRQTGFKMWDKNTNSYTISIAESLTGSIYAMQKKANGGNLFKLNPETYKLEFIKDYFSSGALSIATIDDENNGYFYKDSGNSRQYFSLINGKLISNNEYTFNNINSVKSNASLRLSPYANSNSVLVKQDFEKYYTGYLKNGKVVKEIPFLFPEDFVNYTYHSDSFSIWGSSGNKPFRIFPHIKKYPTLFNHTNSSSIFTLQEDAAGRIWAGSYQGNLAIIENEHVKTIAGNGIMYMNGGSSFNNDMYLIGEGVVGLLKYSNDAQLKKALTPFTTGYFTYISRDKKYFYYGTPAYKGLWQAGIGSLEKNNPVWNKIDSAKGSYVHNILTITEDTLGRIWYGHGRRSLAVYFPDKDSAKTWSTETQETKFGAFASLTDQYGTVWIGSSTNGLWFYNDYTKPANPASFTKVMHPLLNNNGPITALTRFQNWLVIANYDKILLLQIDSLFLANKTIVRYLNPQEASFSSFTEQNTLITSKKDSTIWFSTSDMLYHWDIKKWLRLQWKPVTIFPVLKYRGHSDTLNNIKTFYYEPGVNSFSIDLLYVSTDNLPRYMSAAFIRRGENTDLPPPSLITGFSFQNLNPGKYDFIVEVYEMDGSVHRLQYTIVIGQYLWQKWWFWFLLALFGASLLIYFFNLKRKKQVAELRAQNKEEELKKLKAEQDKKIANLKLVTLSSQFRPHFILNALNTIGAQMYDKPNAETVLSRLGESINLIFNHSQQQKITHPLLQEWKLVENIIQIHQLMYLKNLEVILPEQDLLDSFKNLEIPLGILQIPVENALLHGLSNKETGPWQLIIQLEADTIHVIFTITDNGIGRKRSALLSNYSKHGTGTKNLDEIIQIINSNTKNKISLTIEDQVYSSDLEKFGTRVIVKIPKSYMYEG
jgi:hypothetical protein